MGERILYLVRHGQLDMQAFAQDGMRAGLTDVGREQAEITAEYLRFLDVDAIYSSTLGRALETAVIISKRFPNTIVRRSDLLRELPELGLSEFRERQTALRTSVRKICSTYSPEVKNRPRHFARESHLLFCLPRATGSGRILVSARQLSLRHYANARCPFWRIAE
jgi:bisphosphoglycerate-dependent phosphoglycerate mutase